MVEWVAGAGVMVVTQTPTLYTGSFHHTRILSSYHMIRQHARIWHKKLSKNTSSQLWPWRQNCKAGALYPVPHTKALWPMPPCCGPKANDPPSIPHAPTPCLPTTKSYSCCTYIGHISMCHIQQNSLVNLWRKCLESRKPFQTWRHLVVVDSILTMRSGICIGGQKIFLAIDCHSTTWSWMCPWVGCSKTFAIVRSLGFPQMRLRVQ